MCGILGLIGVEDEVFLSGRRTLLHRGPDDYGGLVWDGVTTPKLFDHPAKVPQPIKSRVLFEHVRLSILDLSKAGWQPMRTPEGRYFIIYNGEVYNYRELRGEMESQGVLFHSQTDTEVVLQAYALWGREALKRFVGMFAFAILDVDQREVFLARDFFGIKPLYYSFHRRGLIFASEIKALLTLPGVKAVAHPQRLYDYLRYGLTGHEPETLFRGIYQLPPAHSMVVPVDQPHRGVLQRYWYPVPKERLRISRAEAETRLRELFLESVALHLRSDVPLGTALSGGIDSSAIVSAIRYLEPSAEIHTFSFVPRGNFSMSEERWIDIVGERVGARVHKVKPDPGDLPRDLDELILAQDEPFGSTSIYAQYRVFRLAQQNGIKVVLDGQGGDELLAGYPTKYYVVRALSLLRQGDYGQFVAFLSSIRKAPASRRFLYILFRLVAALLPTQWQELPRRVLREELIPPWMNKKWFMEREARAQSLWHNDWREALRGQLLQDLERISLPHLLRYEDRNSMWHSIESRVPFLTPQLVHFVYALPEEYILAADGTTKAIFRHAVKGIVPEPILARRDKVGFATPEREWLFFLHPWVDQVLNGEVARTIPVLNLEEARRQWQQLLSTSTFYKPVLWRWINLIRWSERFGVEYE